MPNVTKEIRTTTNSVLCYRKHIQPRLKWKRWIYDEHNNLATMFEFIMVFFFSLFLFFCPILRNWMAFLLAPLYAEFKSVSRPPIKYQWNTGVKCIDPSVLLVLNFINPKRLKGSWPWWNIIFESTRSEVLRGRDYLILSISVLDRYAILLTLEG